MLAEPPSGERDPMAVLDAQDATRVPELVPLRSARMAESAFAFFRGTAALMAADLANSAGTDLLVGSCGDAHVSNFGLYASPQRTLVFDLNDFDEAAWAPWEWDVKRLVTSIVIAGQASSRDEMVVRDAALAAVRTYARSLRAGVTRSPLDRYYDHFDARAAQAAQAAADGHTAKALRAAIKDATKRTGARAARRLTERRGDGRVGFVEAPPTMTHVRPELVTRVEEVFDDYLRSANTDIRVLLSHYAVVDVVRRVVGVGSVGTRCYLIAMQDADGHTVLLQAKEAGPSVLAQHGRIRQPRAVQRYIDSYADGARVVAMQRVLQAVSDPFLGHVRDDQAPGVDFRSYYVRQFHDMKGGFEMDALEDPAFHWYAEACAATLARAHGQSPVAGTVSGYLGSGRAAGEAILEWAHAYAEQSRADWMLFRAHRGV
ncbi:DUF2252 domain-containing protein [Microbacterium sp. NEAU-LLC]|uniref:DUF2252 domain-containing protein n=2 Tax=Microbacterium helvum TaxID=2773713 RepID=A0ABR8NQS4_9MICO|nr:DUF2252 domain-containing protein [Microbacterium helvum]